MNPILKNVLAVILGALVGMGVNMGIIMLSPYIIPPPEGYDPSNIDSMKASIHLLETKHYFMPWLAHALGTLAGAFVAAKVALSRNLMMALLIGAFFLLGGIQMVRMLPSPTWFTFADLIGAYIPMAWLGYLLSGKKSTQM